MRPGYSRLILLILAGWMAGCSAAPQTATPAGSSRAPVLKALHPDAAVTGARFNEQPDGNSALAVECESATNTSFIVFGQEPLKTVFGSDKLLTAIVPARLTARPGSVPVYVENEAGRSNTLTFTVR